MPRTSTCGRPTPTGPCSRPLTSANNCGVNHRGLPAGATADLMMAPPVAADPFASAPPNLTVVEPAAEPVPEIAREDWSVDCDHGDIKAMCPRCYPHLALAPAPRFEAAAGRGRAGGLRSSFSGPDPHSKQALCNRIADVFGDGRSYEVSTGSSEPAEMFRDLYGRYGLEFTEGPDKPTLARGLVELAEGTWDDSCDSTASDSGGGSRVTREGLRRVVDAIGTLEDLFGEDVAA